MWLQVFTAFPVGTFTPTYTAVYLWLDQLRHVLGLGVTLWGVGEAIVSGLKECGGARMERVWKRKGGEIRRYKRTAGVIWKEIGRERRQSCPEAPGVTSEGLQWECEMKEKRYEERAAIDGMKARRKKKEWRDEKQTPIHGPKHNSKIILFIWGKLSLFCFPKAKSAKWRPPTDSGGAHDELTSDVFGGGCRRIWCTYHNSD